MGMKREATWNSFFLAKAFETMLLENSRLWLLKHKVRLYYDLVASEVPL